MSLSERLDTVYSMIDPEAASRGRVIDVGSDHGLLALECLQSGITRSVVCTDIHKAPAERTRLCLKENGYEGSSEVYCTDGLKGVELRPFDTVVMAGMGGNTIISIIEAAMRENDLRDVSFVLQPQKSVDRLRDFLAASGLAVEDETASIDRDLYYICMKCRYTGMPYEITDEDRYYGPLLKDKTDPMSLEYKAHLDDVYKLRSRGDSALRKLLEVRNVL